MEILRSDLVQSESGSGDCVNGEVCHQAVSATEKEALVGSLRENGMEMESGQMGKDYALDVIRSNTQIVVPASESETIARQGGTSHGSWFAMSSDGHDRSRSPYLRKFRDVGEENPWLAKAPIEKKVDDGNSKAYRAKMSKDGMGLDHERINSQHPIRLEGRNNAGFNPFQSLGTSVMGEERQEVRGYKEQNQTWARVRYVIKEVTMNDKGFFFFKFSDEAKRMHCLKDGLWLFQNKSILLQKWQPGMELSKKSPRFIPVWVKFYDIPLELWSSIGLSYIASTVGKPLGMDMITKDLCGDSLGRMGFARILVEVDTARKLPDIIRV
ncbi:hypothetical protein Patl1_25965 [Pistacia atlantica]|uniref:Uncharacterized protein n=1 Tax=Pistacia atlantica TaxID=434234 RepID=A0ACC1B0Z4_9ROSI|nr:hypothetical protein Patl1_25965 [Pistacia atlantica]